ncbi:MAG: hypothetical protein IJW74_00555 [Oscillospiraceae bacterium]|nr:hypothetical protein [Oscillospiraceae bacterium]
MKQKQIYNVVPGQKIGSWLVADDYMLSKNGEKKWHCICNCGTERYVLEHSLKYGGSLSCGCARIERANETNTHKLSGKTFGDLTVLHRAQKQRKNGGVWWTCQCSCGNLCDVPATLLVNGRKTHCGCKTVKEYYSIDITGKKYNMLTALYPTEKRNKKGSVVWHCRCDCGKETDVDYNSLVYSDVVSCGCRKIAHDSVLNEYITFVDGTSIDALKSEKTPTNNTSGVKGVYRVKNKWMAKIVFQKKQYTLGYYEDFEDAVQARKEAEDILVKGTIDHYEKWKKVADNNPEWAKENPMQIRVSKNIYNELEVIFLPVLNDNKVEPSPSV